MTNERILLDTPSATPALGFQRTAQALATMIEASEPRFAVGIFGGWGSGKTTLMQAIDASLDKTRTMAPWFNAWRYEREPHLIVPLLDTIRGALMQWAAARPTPAGASVREAAGRVGRVVRALAKGMSAEVGLLGVAKLTYNTEATVDDLFGADADHTDTDPQSLYYACFEQLREAFQTLADGGIERVVVFIDDLDRCLPSSALDVIESMKLFFDLPGFVFVVGLDRSVVEQAVQVRLVGTPRLAGAADVDGATASGNRRIRKLEREYIKKIFQVPYALPPMVAEQLDELLASVCDTAGLHEDQLSDLRTRVRAYLEHIAVEGHVNPREVKRFINAYTLQMMVRPQLDRDTVLAVQTLAFRDDWAMYDILLSEPDALGVAVRNYRDGDAAALENMWSSLGVLASDLIAFLRSSCAAPLTGGGLRAYITSVETAVRMERWLTEAYGQVGALRRMSRTIPQLLEHGSSAQAVEDVGRNLSHCLADLRRLFAEAGEAERMNHYLDRISELVRAVHGAMNAERAASWAAEVDQQIVNIQRELRLLRQAAGLTAS